MNFLIIKKSVFIFLCLILTACVGNVDRTREGAVAKYSKKQLMEIIVIGKSTKKDVLKFLGRPNIPLEYNEANDWVYLSAVKDRRIYLFIPVFLDKKVMLSVKFNGSNLVEDIIYNES